MIRDRYWLTHIALSSLKKSRLHNVLLIMVDDASQSPTANYLARFSIPEVPIIKIIIDKKEHQGRQLQKNLLPALDSAVRHGCRYVAVLDSDAVVKPEWLERIRELYFRYSRYNIPLIVRGFNEKRGEAEYCDRALALIEKDKSCRSNLICGGISMFFSADLYCAARKDMDRYPWDKRLNEFVRKRCNGLILQTTPSVVQHLGLLSGLNSGLLSGNRSCSFDYPAWWTPFIKIIYYMHQCIGKAGQYYHIRVKSKIIRKIK